MQNYKIRNENGTLYVASHLVPNSEIFKESKDRVKVLVYQGSEEAEDLALKLASDPKYDVVFSDDRDLDKAGYADLVLNGVKPWMFGNILGDIFGPGKFARDLRERYGSFINDGDNLTVIATPDHFRHFGSLEDKLAVSNDDRRFVA